MIYPLEEPLYSKYIKPLADVLNEYFDNDGIVIYEDPIRFPTDGIKTSVQFDLLLEGMKARTRILRFLITDDLEITHVSFKAIPSLVTRIREQIQEIAPQASVSYTHIWRYGKRRLDT